MRNTSNHPILLILDGHGSHETVKMIDLALSHGIIIFCLPPHTTHKLQPLDVGVFGPFSRLWAARCDKILDIDSQGMSREDFVKEYMGVRTSSFKATTIQRAFKKSSSWPVNYAIFSDDDFAPSYTTSTTFGHVPSTFPGLADTSTPSENPDSDDDSEDDIHGRKLPSDDEDSDEEDSESDDEDGPALGAHIQPPRDKTPIPDPFNILKSVDPVVAACPPRSETASRRSQPSEPPQPVFSVPTSNHSLSPDRPPTLTQRVMMLEEQVTILRSQVLISDANCSLAHNEIADLKRKNNAGQAAPRKRQKLNVNARCLTSSEGRQLAQEQELSRAAKVQKKTDAQNRRAIQDVQREQLRQARGDNYVFTGSLASKNIPDLKDIAAVLGVSSTGKKAEILAKITGHFEEHPEKRLDERFKGLFQSRRQRNNENANPAPAPPPPSSSTLTNDHTRLPEPLAIRPEPLSFYPSQHNIPTLPTIHSNPSNTTYHPGHYNTNHFPPQFYPYTRPHSEFTQVQYPHPTYNNHYTNHDRPTNALQPPQSAAPPNLYSYH